MSETELRDRVIEVIRVTGEELFGNTKNYRRHPRLQQETLRQSMAQLGNTSALVAYRSAREDGALVLIDGHLRRDVAPDFLWPVLVLDLSDAEADLALATMDPIASMAINDKNMFNELLDGLTIDAAMQEAIESIQAQIGAVTLETAPSFSELTDEFETPKETGDDYDESSDWPMLRFHCPRGVLGAWEDRLKALNSHPHVLLATLLGVDSDE